MTNSLIAMEVGANRYRMVYCHSDGYLTHNGALLADHYETPEKVAALLDLGDLSILRKKAAPDPDIQSLDNGGMLKEITVAYSRDLGESDTQAEELSLEKLNSSCHTSRYVYIYTGDNEWKYFRSGHLDEEGLLDVKEDLETEYSKYGLNRPEGYYGQLNASIAADLKNQIRQQMSSGDMSPLLTM